MLCERMCVLVWSAQRCCARGSVVLYAHIARSNALRAKRAWRKKAHRALPSLAERAAAWRRETAGAQSRKIHVRHSSDPS